MIEFIYGVIVGAISLMGIAVLDVAVFKDKAIAKKMTTFRTYLFYSCIELIMFLMGYLVGRK